MGNIEIRIALAVGILNRGVIYVRNAGQTRNGQATLRGGVVRYAKHGSPIRVQCMLGSSSVSAGSFRACLQIWTSRVGDRGVHEKHEHQQKLEDDCNWDMAHDDDPCRYLDLPDALLDASDSLHNGGLVPVGSFWDMNLVSESFVCIQWFHQSSDMLAQIPAPVVSDALSCNTTGKNRGCPRVQRIDVESAPSPTAPVVCAESKTPCYGGYWDTVGNNCLGYSVNRTRNQSIHGSNCSLSKSVGRASLKPFGLPHQILPFALPFEFIESLCHRRHVGGDASERRHRARRRCR